MKHLSKEAVKTLKNIAPNPGETEIIDLSISEGDTRTVALQKEDWPSRILKISVIEKTSEPDPHLFAKLEFNVKCGTNLLSATLINYRRRYEHIDKDGTRPHEWRASTPNHIPECIHNNYLNDLDQGVGLAEVSMDEALDHLEYHLDEIKNLNKSPDKGLER